MPQPLGEVKIEVYIEDDIFLKDVDMETAVKYQYLRNLFNQSAQYSKDENFRRLIMALNQNFNVDSVNQLVYLAISCLAIPKFFHKYGFLLQQFKSSNIQELVEKINIKVKLESTTKVFAEFFHRIELWEKLEVFSE